MTMSIEWVCSYMYTDIVDGDHKNYVVSLHMKVVQLRTMYGLPHQQS